MFLTILKISGIAVLSILGIIVLTLLLLLFVPIRYRAKGVAAEIADPAVATKAQLGEAYGLKAFSGVGKEWNEQTLAFCEYVTGKTFEEVKGIALTETTSPAEADLAGSVSIAVGDFMGLVEKAAE